MNFDNFAAMKTLLLVISLFIFSDFTVNTSADKAFDALETALVNGDAKAIVSHVEDKILLEINKQESVYSKQQASQILKDFFDKNKVKSFKVKSKSNTKGNYAMLGTLTSASGATFRVSLKLREKGNYFVLDKLGIVQ